MTVPPGTLDPHGVAEMTGLSIHAIYRYTSDGRLPPPDYRPCDRCPIWEVETIEAWMEARR